jgi:H+/Cl- antiporter ClcA
MKQHSLEQITIFMSVIKWLFLSITIGIMIGATVTLFLNILSYSEDAQHTLPIPHYFMLPFALLFSVWIVKKFAPDAEGHGTEKVIEAVHKKDGKIDTAVIPVKLFATVLTIFSGGSVGKEGPGAQIGGGAASFVSELFHFSKKDRKKLVICGISAGFATVFGTPIAGAIFGVEVLFIGLIMYDVLLPSFIAGFAAFYTAQYLGVTYTYFDIRFFDNVVLDLPLIGQVIIAGLFFGVVSDFTITMLRNVKKSINKIPINIYLKAFLGGLILVIGSFFVGTNYFGLGLDTIESLLNPYTYVVAVVPWYDFIVKSVYTAITLGVGGSGGIITPLFYIGASSGHLFGTVMGDNVALFAALGFVSVLAGATNAPIAAIVMAMEIFGLEVAHYAAISAVISFLITGHRSVFSSQILSMRKSEMLSVAIGEEVEHSDAKIGDKEQHKIQSIKDRLAAKRIQRAEQAKRHRNKLNE